MGANTINTVLEGLAKKVQPLIEGEILMSIMSNLSPERVCKATFSIPIKQLNTPFMTGEEVARKIVMANDIAKFSIFRATTHNKGILNGITAMGLALG